MKANYHTHLKLCGHAEGMSADYVQLALENGFEIIGISDHGPIKPEFMSEKDFIFNWLDRQMTYEDFLNIYLPDCLKTKEEYKDKIKVLIGVEIEYIPEFHDYFVKLREKLDYMNLAGHYYYHNGEMINSYEEVTYNNVYSYGLNAKAAMETGLFEIMVHPDVFMYNYKSYDGKATFDDKCEEVARMIIETAIKNNIYLEINVGGIFKVTSSGAVLGQFAYPRDEFWKIASEYKDLKVVVGVDAHKPQHLIAKEVEMAYEFTKKHNINVLETVETIG